MSSSQSEYNNDDITGWVRWFCGLEDHQFFCEVDDEFIQDTFNLYGLKQKFNRYNEAIQTIRSAEGPDEQELEDQRYLELYQQITDVYGLIYAKWIMTPKGMNIMKQKYMLGKFGVCPKVLCERQNVLPVGMSQQIRTSRVKVYCPKCQDIFIPKKKCPDVDGAYFGCSFPQAFLMTFSEFLPSQISTIYIPRIYGFKIYKQKGSKYEDIKKLQQISFYSQDHLKKIKNKKHKL